MMHGGGKYACLTLDMEPDHCDLVDGDHYASFKRLGDFISAIKGHGLAITVFATGRVLEERPEDVRALAEEGAEVKLHTYSHKRGMVGTYEIERGVAAYRELFGVHPKGYRAPLGLISPCEVEYLAKEGFFFDSSLFPSLFPGRFCNIAGPTAPFFYPGTQLLEIPFSVIPRIRFPISLSYIQLAGFPVFRILSRILGLPPVLVIDFHLHDLFPSPVFNELPMKWKIIYSRCLTRRRWCGLRDFDRLVRLVKSRGYSFITMLGLYRSCAEGACP